MAEEKTADSPRFYFRVVPRQEYDKPELALGWLGTEMIESVELIEEPIDGPSEEVAQTLLDELSRLESEVISISRSLKGKIEQQEREREPETIRDTAILTFLGNASDEDVQAALENHIFDLDAVMGAALRSLERANQTAEEAVIENGRFSRLFDRKSRIIEERQRALHASLEALVNG